MNEDTCKEKSGELVVFAVGTIICGLCVTHVVEICRSFEIAPVHRTPSAIRGVMHLRGQVVTVVDMRTVFNFPQIPVGKQSRIILVKSQNESLGLLVDAVDDIIAVEPQNLQPSPPNVNGVAGSLFTCIYKMPRELVPILDLEEVLKIDGESKRPETVQSSGGG